jgi:exopolysaccharide biosynthesis polyprenyl glycosylphosphotransferase
MIEGSGSTAARSRSRARGLTTKRHARGGLGWEPLGRARLSALIDLLALSLASLGSSLPLSEGSKLGPGKLAALVALTVLLLAIGGIYRTRMAHSYLNELPVVVAASGLAAAVLTFAAIFFGSGTGVAAQAAEFWLLAAVCLAVGRGALRVVEISRWRRGKGGHPTLILGAGKVGHLIARRLLDKPESGLRPVGFVDDTPMESWDEAQVPILGPDSELDSVVASYGIEHAILSFSAAPHERTLAAARRLDELGVTVSLVPRLFEGIPDRTVLDRIAGIPVISVFPTDPRGWQLSVKYAADRVVATLALVLLCPVLALAAIMVLLDLGRPILFRQRRVGIDGQEFEMLKFRTMKGDPDSKGQANSDWAAAVLAGEKGLRARPARDSVSSNRVTRVGRVLRKTAVDELPQMLNVARGEMSLIGPRPEMPEFANQFERTVHRYGDRHRVKSGITGWAQVHGLRGRTSLSDRVVWDNYYIENWSPWLDLKILLMTLLTIIRDPAE